MKTKIFLIALVAVFFSSCDSMFGSYKMELVGSGTFLVSVANDNGQTTQNYNAGTYDIGENENWSVSAQSNNGSGVTVKMFIGSELIKSASANGYGVVSIHN